MIRTVDHFNLTIALERNEKRISLSMTNPLVKPLKILEVKQLAFETDKLPFSDIKLQGLTPLKGRRFSKIQPGDTFKFARLKLNKTTDYNQRSYHPEFLIG